MFVPSKFLLRKQNHQRGGCANCLELQKSNDLHTNVVDRRRGFTHPSSGTSQCTLAFPWELSFPIGKVGVEKTKEHFQKQTCQHVTHFFGLSCQVFKRTEYRECVLIGNCYWLSFLILFVAWYSECSNWFIVPLLAIVSTDVNMLILEKTLYCKILSPKIKGSNKAPYFCALSRATFFHCVSCL